MWDFSAPTDLRVAKIRELKKAAEKEELFASNKKVEKKIQEQRKKVADENKKAESEKKRERLKKKAVEEKKRKELAAKKAAAGKRRKELAAKKAAEEEKRRQLAKIEKEELDNKREYFHVLLQNSKVFFLDAENYLRDNAVQSVATLKKMGKFISVKNKMICKNDVDIRSTCVTKRSKEDLDIVIGDYEEFFQTMNADQSFFQFQKEENLKRRNLEKAHIIKVKEKLSDASKFLFKFSVSNLENKNIDDILKYLEVLETHKKLKNYEDSLKYEIILKRNLSKYKLGLAFNEYSQENINTAPFNDGEKIKGGKLNTGDGSLKAVGINGVSPEQAFMENLINNTIKSIPEGANNVKIKRIWIEASKTLCSSRKFNAKGLKMDWVGNVSGINMNDDGTFWLSVDIKNGNKVRDSNVAKRFEDLLGMLEPASLLTKGDSIRFSGTFKKGDTDENECLDAGLDSNPELEGEAFTFKFTKIERNL